ncbi:hypothetical protein AVEN_229091-1 [Araneus ventricosus]|uniref:Uncharacterized protein n=1 Tax=Araneus ventricosus TaxID=182803 RepID=A0A4Y2IX82_ARAVE|nr:hypothetical protein AVEN_229091-1 [Araneus ventricosus]
MHHAHFSIAIHNHLHATFAERWIRRSVSAVLSPHSSDLKPLDFFVCGSLKPDSPVDSLVDLIARILTAVSDVINRLGTFEHTLWLFIIMPPGVL